MELRQAYRWLAVSLMMPVSLMMIVSSCLGRTDIDWWDVDELDTGVDASIADAARDVIQRDSSDASGYPIDSAPGDAGGPDGFPYDVVMDTRPQDGGFPDGTIIDTGRPDGREASVMDTGRPDGWEASVMDTGRPDVVDSGGGDANDAASDSGGVTCTECLFVTCGGSIGQCLTNSVCAQGMQCVVQTCIFGGHLDPACAISCFAGDLEAGILALNAVTCVLGKCGQPCLSLFLGNQP